MHIGIKKNKVLYGYIIFVVFIYSIPMAFNLLFASTPLSPWKQIVWFPLMYLFIKRKRCYNYYYNKHVSYALLSFYLLLIGSLNSILIGYNSVRIIYSFWVYLAGFPFLLMMYEVKRRDMSDELKKFLIILSVMITVGLIVDHYSGIFNVIKIKGGDDFALNKSELSRATFLFESPTGLTNYFNFLLLCVCVYFIYEKKSSYRKYYIVLICLFVIAGFYTGSRQLWLTSGIIIIVTIVVSYWERMKKLDVLSILVLLMAIIFMSGYFINIVKKNESDSEIADRIVQIKDDERINSYYAGLRQYEISNVDKWFVGHGIASTMGQKARVGESIGYHFESSLFATFYEIGIMAYVVILVPVFNFFFVLLKFKNSSLKILLCIYFGAFIFIYTVTPGGLGFTSLMSINIVGGMIYNYNWLLSNLKDEVEK